jgi:sugar lactone lactonase YvrE
VGRQLSTVVDGLAFAEGPRWHDGRLWFSDMHGHAVMNVAADGSDLRTVVEVSLQPSGLGWDPDGLLLIVSMVDRRLLRLEADGSLSSVADLSSVATWHCNDMVVDTLGRAYVGNFGFDLYGANPTPVATALALVDRVGTVRVAADNLRFPNGTVITPDGSTLVVGESFGGCLTAFDIATDGSLSGRRVWAQLSGAVPDGICLDAEGAIWAASPISNEVVRVAEGGEVLERVRTGERQAFACMLGGADRRTLFVCTAMTSEPEESARTREGRIEAVQVDVPGAGLP